MHYPYKDIPLKLPELDQKDENEKNYGIDGAEHGQRHRLKAPPNLSRKSILNITEQWHKRIQGCANGALSRLFFEPQKAPHEIFQKRLI